MRWYFNDASLQGQFNVFDAGSPDDGSLSFEEFLRELLSVRPSIRPLHITRTLSSRFVSPGTTLQAAVQQSRKPDLKRAVLTWLDRAGPFIEDDRLFEQDDLFACLGIDVTDSGLGEAARRVKSAEPASTFSASGGGINFAVSPLEVAHGLKEHPLGSIEVENVWSIGDLRQAAANEPEINTWQTLIEVARLRFTNLILPDAIWGHKTLAREAYSGIIGNAVLVLLGHLDAYMSSRGVDGAETPKAREIVENYFVGDRAAFTGESETNRKKFKNEMTFPRPDGTGEIFAHYHGKISHRVFRLHFQYPVPSQETKMHVLYLGPKITKG